MVFKRSKLFISMIGLILLFNLSINVYADENIDLNGIGINETTETKEVIEVEEQDTQEGLKLPNLPATSEEKKEKTENTAKAIGDMFNNVGVDEDSVRKANEFLKPFAVIMNKIMAIILGVTSLLMMFITVLDLLYMAFPPVRDLLDGGSTGGQIQGRNRGMYGMRGQMGMPGAFNSGMVDGPRMGMQQVLQGQATGGGLSALGRWVSDEAIAACYESKGGPMGAVQGGPSVGPVKSMLFSYMKKRSLFLIMFGICVILFTSTVFTDLGVRIGIWLLNLLIGIGS